MFACDENFKDAKADDGTVLLNTEEWVLTDNDANSVELNMSAVLDGIFTKDTTEAKVFSDTSFFDNANHIGAVSADNDWTAGWTVALD